MIISLISPHVGAVLCLSPRRTFSGPCQSITLPRAQNTEQSSRTHFDFCLTSSSCKSYASFLDSNLVHLPSGEKLHPDDDELVCKDGLYPIHVLVQPLSQRFKYHFEGSRQTNKLDKVALLRLPSSYLIMFSPSGTSRTSSMSLTSIDHFLILSSNAFLYPPNLTTSMHGYDLYILLSSSINILSAGVHLQSSTHPITTCQENHPCVVIPPSASCPHDISSSCF